MTDLCPPDCSWPGNCPCYDHVAPEPTPTRQDPDEIEDDE